MAPALVGSHGAFSQATGSAITPSFGTGETRAVGNLLAAFVEHTNSAPPSVSSGWTMAATGSATNANSVTIYSKVATGGDSGPTLTPASGAFVRAMLAEFSGTNPTNANVIDKYAGAADASSTSSQQSITATTAHGDAVSGELTLIAAMVYGSAVTGVTSHTVGSGSYVDLANIDSTAANRHYRHGYVIPSSNASADTDTFTYTLSGKFASCLAIASFAIASVPGTINFPGVLDDAVSLIDAGNQSTTTLSATLNSGDTTATVTDSSSFPTSGTITIPSSGEIAYYNGKT